MTWQIFDNLRLLLFVTISTMFIFEHFQNKSVPVARIHHELRKQISVNINMQARNKFAFHSELKLSQNRQY